MTRLPAFARTLACLLVAAATLVPATADAQYFGRNKVRYDDFDFRILATEHFDLYYYEGMEDAAQDAARMAERWYERLSTILDHQFDERKSIILYADDADFRQTNIANIGQGTQGVTEGLRQRVVLPMAGTYAETDHVLGHELVHQFQYDIAKRSGTFQQFVRLPLFLIEGMAEYYTVGREDALTATWMRDAVLRDDFPTVGDLQRNPRYNEYQYGQPFWAFVAGTYGDEAGVRMFKTALQIPLDSAIVAVTGLTPDSLSARWLAALQGQLVPPAEGREVPRPDATPRIERDIERYRARVARDQARGRQTDAPRPPGIAYPERFARLEAGRLLAGERQTGNINIAPQLSPDGRYVAYLSERDLFGIDLFLADAESGEVVSKLEEVGTDAHFDAIRFIESAGTWSPDGSQFAYVVFAGGDNEIALLDVDRRDVVRRIAVRGIGAIKDPAWSPDGRQIAFAGVKGGITDLYVVDLESGTVRQLTDDRYADLQPAWSPDGETIAFATDRGPQTDFERLTFGPMQLSLLTVATGQIEPLRLFPGRKQINPAWSPDGESLYFISDHAGFNDVYRWERATGDLYQVTRLATGVAGISDLSPALSVAQGTGALAFSVFEAQRYSVYRLAEEEARGTRVAEGADDATTADILPPGDAVGRSRVEGYLADNADGLPDAQPFPTRDFRSRLSLDYVSQPTVGVGYDPYASGGFGVGGAIQFRFSDQLSDNILAVAVAANGTFKDIGGQGLYLNQSNRLTYGAVAGRLPYLQSFFGQDPTGSYFTRYYFRTYVSQAAGLASYPLNQTQRFELQGGYRGLGYDLEYDEFALVDIDDDGTPDGRVFDGRRDADIEQVLGFDASTLHLGEVGAAFVGDYSYFGFTSPIRGGRYRFSVDGVAGSIAYASVTADVRRYQMVRVPGFPKRLPITLAARALHFGRYGGDGENGRLRPLYVGYGTLVRGYSFRSFSEDAEFEAFAPRLFGSKLGVASAEVRVPLLGVPQLGLLTFPYLPTELTLFADAGVAWGRSGGLFGLDPDGAEADLDLARDPVYSVGSSLRMNVLGALIVEPYFALPLSRGQGGVVVGPDGAEAPYEGRRYVFGLNLSPGW